MNTNAPTIINENHENDTHGTSETATANGAAGPTETPILALDHVGYAYTKGGKRVLDDRNYAFHRGRVTSITGPSGAGKTTLLSLLSGLTTPTDGRVLYDGRDLAKADRYRYRSRDIGVIFQSFNLLPALTVAENIVLSMDASGKGSTDRRTKSRPSSSRRSSCVPDTSTNASCTCRAASSSASRSRGR